MLIFAWMKSLASNEADLTVTGALLTITCTEPAAGKFAPLIFKSKTPPDFLLTLIEVISSPTSLPATISLDKSVRGFVLRSRTARGPAVSLIEGFASRKTAKLGLGSLGFGTAAVTTVPLIKT